MPAFEMTFEVPALSEAIEDRVVEVLDATIAEHFGVLTATVLVSASDCVAAAKHALELMGGIGVAPLRLVDDLVSRSEIAERAGVTRQAVANWVGGVRQAATAFPAPYVLSNGGLWLWGEVLAYLRAIGIDADEHVAYPTRREAQLIGDLIAAGRAGSDIGRSALTGTR